MYRVSVSKYPGNIDDNHDDPRAVDAAVPALATGARILAMESSLRRRRDEQSSLRRLRLRRRVGCNAKLCICHQPATYIAKTYGRITVPNLSDLIIAFVFLG